MRGSDASGRGDDLVSAGEVFVITTEMADDLACSRDVDRLDGVRLLR